MFNKKLPQPTMQDIENAIKKLEKEVIYLRSKFEESNSSIDIETIDPDMDRCQHYLQCYDYYIDFQRVVNSMNMFRVKNKLEYFPKYIKRPSCKVDKLLIKEFKSYVIEYNRVSDKLFDLLSRQICGCENCNIYVKIKNTINEEILPYIYYDNFVSVQTLLYRKFFELPSMTNYVIKTYLGCDYYE